MSACNGLGCGIVYELSGTTKKSKYCTRLPVGLTVVVSSAAHAGKWKVFGTAQLGVT